MMRASEQRPERAPRSVWFDPRFAIGIVLVIGSVAGVVALFGSTNSTVQVWAARAALTAGDTVNGDDLVLRDVQLGEMTGLYLPHDGLPPEGLILTRTVAAGELVPASAVGAAEGARVASVVVRSTGQLPAAIATGTVVDVWTARPTDDGAAGPPAVLVSSATVVRVLETDGLIARGSTTGVELLVPRQAVAGVLEAIANEDPMSLVPVGLSVGG